MKWRSLALAVVAVGGLVLLMGYFAGWYHDKVSSKDPAGLSVAGARLTITPEQVESVEPIPGTISATDETLVGSRILATITAIRVRAGDKVAPGDVLVEFDDKSQKSVLEQRQQVAASAQASFEDATLNRDRALQLVESGNLSRADYDRAMTAYRVAAAQLEGARRAVAEAQAQLGYTRVVAPMGGTVVDRYAEPGDMAVPGQSLLRLFNPGRLRVEAVLRESLIAKVVQGQQIRAKVDALSAEVPAVVEEVVPSADPGSRTFLIKALLPSQENLYPGMFARLMIPVGSRSVLRVPRAAVQHSGQLDFLYLAGAEGVQRRFVRLGEPDAEWVEVISGIEPGSVIIVPES
ncbi:MAG: efflux RND transporter periplasmic adaptor subunit [Pseudomonadales bacterium]|nr:efflux RND transporter periplasmic adaptor subunit [Pseudomonadales bacterium]